MKVAISGGVKPCEPAYCIALVRSCVTLQDLTPAPLYICWYADDCSVENRNSGKNENLQYASISL